MTLQGYVFNVLITMLIWYTSFFLMENFNFYAVYVKANLYSKRNVLTILRLVSTIRSCILKGYLRCKTITSQNVPFEAQVNNFFVSEKNYVPFSRYSSFDIFNHP